MREYFLSSKTVSEKEIVKIEQDAVNTVSEAITFASTECTEPSIDTLYQDIYADGEVIK